ncbi:hypothetical protein [Mesorhizobium sp. WSM4312]|uniref:hypothetical protein n=1 Tax=Mesorhizobium sp. WSM4312 TaxID=2029411 RepID=UPI00117E14E7|nr:hypothetical protein [Mesorhizobium sp. WSM4312]
MSLAEGFARDGIGASLLGFEIFVCWTSSRERVQFDLSGRTSFGEYATDDELVTVSLRRWRISG